MKAEDFAASIGARVVMPSKSLLQGKRITHYFCKTDVAATWAEHREAQKAPVANVSQIKRKATK